MEVGGACGEGICRGEVDHTGRKEGRGKERGVSQGLVMQVQGSGSPHTDASFLKGWVLTD